MDNPAVNPALPQLHYITCSICGGKFPHVYDYMTEEYSDEQMDAIVSVTTKDGYVRWWGDKLGYVCRECYDLGDTL